MQNFNRFTTFSLRLSAFALVIALSACNSESTTGTGTGTTEVSAVPAAAPASAVTMSSVNIAPAIVGTPATSATLGAAYSFTPSATDVNSDSLTFSIQNKPSWATFDSTTGQLFGTPDSLGVSGSIVIAVSDGMTTSSLAPFTITVASGSAVASAQVSWTAPTVNTDGTALADLAGFHVYYGTNPAQLTRIDVQGAGNVSYVASNLTAGTYYFTVAAYNSAGVESALPAVISTVIS